MPGKQRVITPAAYNSMGFALPAAIGAKIAKPSKEVIAICGDGSFLMTGMELITAVRYNLDLTAIVLHDKKYNILCLFQDLKFKRQHPDTCINTFDFGLFAKSIGSFFVKIENNGDIKEGVEEAISYKGPSLVEVCVDEKELPRISGIIKRMLSASHNRNE
jgi:acetolactate synthase-1/2/3 large subunit